MSLILSIETATPACSVALHQNGILLSLAELHIENAHSEQLTMLIEQVMQRAKRKLEELDAVAVSKGPGSYTGLRIGVSTAKGLCFALDKPLLAINTLEAMVEQLRVFRTESTLFCPMIDARRMEVYCLVADENLQILSPTEAKIIENNAFEEFLHTYKMVFFGNGAQKCQELISHKNALFVEGFTCSAKSLGQLAHAKFLAKDFEELIYFEPFYLKDFVSNAKKH